ncbi:MAG: helix-turn-helix domain-containing protein, partial [Pseudomonadota bacterium]
MAAPLTIGFLIFPGFPMACLTSFIEPLRAANEISSQRAFAWQLIAEHPGRVRSSAEVDFDPGATLETAKGLDYLIVLSPPSADFVEKSTAPTLRALSRHGVTLGAVSGGVFPLVKAGLGDHRPLSVHWCYRAAFEAAFPNKFASDQVLEIDKRFVTASGAAAAFDLALHLIETQLNAATATEVACWFQHPMMRKANVQQAVPSGDITGQGAQLPNLVSRAVEMFAVDMTEPLKVAEVAGALDISARHLERSFKQSTGLSPSHYYRKMRMEAARQIVMYTNDRLSDIAASVGYVSQQAFNKHYQSSFGVTPNEDRKR